MIKMKKDILTVEDILTEQEVKEYHSQWDSFRDRHGSATYKNKPLSPYQVHSNKPVIGKIFQFKDYPIFRSRVFQKILKEIDPYFITKNYLHPFWHLDHYRNVSEQIYHASMNKIRNHDIILAKELDVHMDLKEETFWKNKISMELIYKFIGKSDKKKIEKLYFTLYDDKDNRIKGKLWGRTFVTLRNWAKFLEGIKQGDKESLDLLIKQIETQDNHLQILITPRQNLQTTKEELITKLRSGQIPEEQLYDFFSLWDKN